MLAFTVLTALAAAAPAFAGMIFSAVDRDLCLAPEGPWDGARIVLMDCYHELANANLWEHTDDGMAWVEFPNAGNRVLDVREGSAVGGTIPQIWGSGGPSPKQLFRLRRKDDSGAYQITWGPMCVDVREGNSGAALPVQWSDCADDENPNQIWYWMT